MSAHAASLHGPDTNPIEAIPPAVARIADLIDRHCADLDLRDEDWRLCAAWAIYNDPHTRAAFTTRTVILDWPQP